MSSIGNKEIFAKNLKYYVERSGKTQKEIADYIEVPAGTLNNWVKGKKYPRIDKIEKLAQYFGILKSDLIEDKEKQSTKSELSAKKIEFIKRVESMSDDQIARLEQILDLVENTKL